MSMFFAAKTFPIFFFIYVIFSLRNQFLMHSIEKKQQLVFLFVIIIILTPTAVKLTVKIPSFAVGNSRARERKIEDIMILCNLECLSVCPCH